MNVNLNAGGVIGGLLGAAIAFAFLLSGDDPEYRRGMVKFVVLGVVVGALGGNFLWGLVTRKSKSESNKNDDSDRGSQDRA